MLRGVVLIGCYSFVILKSILRFWVVSRGCIRRRLFIKVLSSSVSTHLLFLNCNFIIFLKWINVCSCHLSLAHFFIFYYSGLFWQFMCSQILFLTTSTIITIHRNAKCIFEALQSHPLANKTATSFFLLATSHALR